MTTLTKSLAALVPVAVLLSSSIASAQQAPTSEGATFMAPDPEGPPAGVTASRAPVFARAASEKPPRVWYGWQMLIGYGVSDVFLAAGLVAARRGPSATATPLFVAGLAGHGLTGPIVHAANGEGLRAAGSLAMTDVPPVAISAGIMSQKCSGFLCGVGQLGTAVGISALSVGVANIVDVAALAYRDKRPDPKGTGWTVSPVVGPQQAALQVGGRF